MIWLAKTFFWLHSTLCLVYLVVVGRAALKAVTDGSGFGPTSFRFGDILVLNNDKVVDGMTYLVLGLFLLYAEIYMYRVYAMATFFVQ